MTPGVRGFHYTMANRLFNNEIVDAAQARTIYFPVDDYGLGAAAPLAPAPPGLLKYLFLQSSEQK
jgi:hypothetical protein